MNADDGVLAGLKVIDCATYVAGPAAATIMSDFGADVMKIERVPDGDLWRTFPSISGYPKADVSYTWLLTSRNKRSIALDLSKEAGRDVLIRLAGNADVFVTNYQLSLLKKFRLTWEDLRPINQRLIYALITGYGESGEDADAPGYDGLAYWARSGLMTSVTGVRRQPHCGTARDGRSSYRYHLVCRDHARPVPARAYRVGLQGEHLVDGGWGVGQQLRHSSPALQRAIPGAHPGRSAD